MKRFIHICSLHVIILGICLVSCQKLRPEKINVSEYPDLSSIYVDQYKLLHNETVQKEVWLNGDYESKVIPMDSARWKEELLFLKEIDPSKPELVGVFEKTENKKGILLLVKNGEKSSLRRLGISYEGGLTTSINAIIHEQKEVFTYYHEIQVKFSEGIINQWQIKGYQSMMLSDTVNFELSARVK